ncbi:MAG: glycoside hydrolase family 2 protein [Mucilaginibacter sp.]
MNKILALVLFFALAPKSYAQTARVVINFNQDWQMFRLDSAGEVKATFAVRGTSFSSQFNQEHLNKTDIPTDSIISRELNEALNGYGKEYPQIQSLKWESVSLPHPARYEKQLNPGVNQFSGICYYRKKFYIPDGWQNKHTYIKFEGAMQTASVWVNNKFVKQHQGGYLPFSIPLDGIARPGKNEIVVRLDNRDNNFVPPGKPLAKLGFLYWSGIYRNVWLVCTNSVYITDPIAANTVAGGGVFIRPDSISPKAATLHIKTQVKSILPNAATPVTVKQIVLAADGKTIVAETKNNISINSVNDIDQDIRLQHPRLWSPNDPYLYTLVTEVWSGKVLLDNYSQKTGIRKLEYSRKYGFKLNGKPLKIVGTNRHQDMPYVGNALSDAAECRDLKRIKEAGFNFVRLCHYPQAPSVYHFCDSIGLMVADPIPGWQFYNQHPLFKERVFRDIRETVRRDRNHPCVIMWEMSLNESYPPDDFRIKSAMVAHEEYPGDNFFTAGDTYAAKKTAWDIPYNDWLDPFGRPQNVQPDKAGFVREYGDYEFGGSESTTRINRSNGEQALLQNAWNLQWEHNLLMGPQYYPWTVGDANWAFFDGFEAFTKGTSDWGVMDVYRLPKFSYYFFKSQRDYKPMLYIANWWLPASRPVKVVVYSNCDRVALYINGKFIEQRLPDAGPDTDYGDYEHGGYPFNGGNGRHLAHPPFTFDNVKWQPGKLTAVGYKNGKKVAAISVHSPMRANHLSLTEDDENIPLRADGADVVFVHANVADANDTISCLDNSTKVLFTVKGNGCIIGPDSVGVRGGIATVLIRANKHAGPITINASADKLSATSLTIQAIR